MRSNMTDGVIAMYISYYRNNGLDIGTSSYLII